MALFKCKMCGGTLEINDGESIALCEYCGTKQTIPTAKDEALQGLFNRANILRMKSEFDKSEQLYEKIIQADQQQAEAYWGLILCKYGIEYVEDPKTFKRIPTCHRASFESIISDDDYKSALEYADYSQRTIYEEEAKEIDRLQKEILELSKKETPYDVFICYKETDDAGTRTQDSVIANDIYYQLTQEGLKVFYAAITLEDKLGSAYEPCIFAALNSAKVMLSIGTKPEYFNAVWVKNEWSRFLKLMKNDRSKMLIPCYRDMDAYELPEEFGHLQAQDMGKIGFINDIVRGIKKVISSNDAATSKQGETYSANVTVEPLLKRVFMFLEDEDYTSANEYAEKVLDLDPENATAYWGILLASYKCSSDDKFLANMIASEQILDDNKVYQKAVRFGGEGSKYKEFNLKIKKFFQGECDLLTKQIEQLNGEIVELESELSTFEPMLHNFNAKKKEQEELQKQEHAQIAGLDTEYERYAQERRNLLKEKETLPFWNKKRKTEIDECVEKINIALQDCVKKKSQLKEEINSKYKQINEELAVEENALQSKMAEPKLLIGKKKSEINKLSQEKDRLLKLC